jgi:hypothetical protein
VPNCRAFQSSSAEVEAPFRLEWIATDGLDGMWAGDH